MLTGLVKMDFSFHVIGATLYLASVLDTALAVIELINVAGSWNSRSRFSMNCWSIFAEAYVPLRDMQ
jgi:hypothetical protein